MPGNTRKQLTCYKTLLKHANNADWRKALAQCYLQRALAFAAKGMIKEALVLWENYAQNAEPPHEALDHYIIWLLQTNDMAKVKTCLGQLSAQQLDEHYPDLAGLLGLLIITGKVSCQEHAAEGFGFHNAFRFCTRSIELLTGTISWKTLSRR